MPKPEFFLRSAVAGAAAGVALVGGAAEAQSLPVRVTADRADSAPAPLSLVVSQSELRRRRTLPAGATQVPFQSEPAGTGKVKLTFIAPALKKGESKVVVLTPGKPGAVEVKAVGKNAEVWVAGQLFTRYDTTTGPNKPYLYPIVGFGGKHLTRRWPLEPDTTGEAHDHPHHRGLWFTHGEMNGVDFWTEVATPNHPVGKTVHTGYTTLTSGPVYGKLETTTDWVDNNGKTLAKDTREIVVTPVGESVALDFAITVTAVGGPLVWGDTKEGTFGIRVPESMKADKPGDGTLINAEGLRNAALWGKPSPWNDYYGSVEGETLGMAIFDSPTNPRYPSTWHSRTYGLFAANPFGLHDYDSTKKTPRHAGDLTTAEGKSVTFRYRVLFHKGDTKSAGIADAFAAWATPPKVELVK